ncbi:hypothetical protein Tco_0238828, partial [Tanacetum coccineum]
KVIPCLLHRHSPDALAEAPCDLQITGSGFGQCPAADSVSRSTCLKHLDKTDRTHTALHNPHSMLRIAARCRSEPRLRGRVRTTSVGEPDGVSSQVPGRDKEHRKAHVAP